MVVVTRSAIKAMLDEMDARFYADLPHAHCQANLLRLAAGREPLTYEESEQVLRVIQGGDDIVNLLNVGIESGELTGARHLVIGEYGYG